MNYLCDVIVLTWNQLDITKTFVESFLAFTDSLSRLIIIDNGSSDGTKEYLSSLKDTERCKFVVVLNNENKGFVEGVNQGIKLSDASYVCLANNDLIFSKGWLAEIISVFENNKQIGLLNPNSNNLGEKIPKDKTIDKFAKDLNKKFKGQFMEMTFCIGFCLVTKREVIEKVGGLSEEFKPMFFEDTDYSLKVANAGYLIGVAKGTYVWHQEHGSFRQWPKEKTRVFERSREVFNKKWGKILRIAWVAETKQAAVNDLSKVVNLTREGNFVWVLIRNSDIDRESVFLENGYFIHTGVKFIKYRNLLHLIWLILKKKKRYNILISKNKFIKKLFCKFNYNLLNISEKEKINEIKYSSV